MQRHIHCFSNKRINLSGSHAPACEPIRDAPVSSLFCFPTPARQCLRATTRNCPYRTIPSRGNPLWLPSRKRLS
ncbi:MAG: hypothetical protein KAI83_17455 [Thiomargarita sp.]|nr:hypothetical protein [Thiomargarita sp.]